MLSVVFKWVLGWGLMVALALPLLVNLFGWNLYCYVRVDERDWILAAASGVCHCANGEPMEPIDGEVVLHDGEEVKNVELLRLGGVVVFAERRLGEMTWFSFDRFEGDESFDYRGFEFPWLLLLVLPVGVLLGFYRIQK